MKGSIGSGRRSAYADYARGGRGGDATPSLRALRARLILVALVIVLGLAALAGRLAHLQIFRATAFLDLARAQHERTITLDPHRGPIVDRNGRELALTLDVDSVYADPAMVSDPAAVARQLAPLLDMKSNQLSQRLKSDRHFVWVKRKIEPELRRRIEKLKLPGVGFVRESRRFYPKQHLAAHIVGGCGVDNQGLAGLEFAYDEVIRGTPGRILFLQDGHGGHVLDRSRTEPMPGSGLMLTIDGVIQHIAERELDAAMKKSSARAAAIVVLRPQTGEILALASRPTFDPNAFSKAAETARRNHAVSDIYEPGSTLKAITAAAALDAGAIRPDDTIWCENGSIVVARHRFREDDKPFGKLTFTEVLAKSSNVGAIKIAQRLAPESFLDALQRFGFGARTGFELPGESPGLLRDVSRWSGLSQASIAMGQEIGVTPLQVATAFGAIANDGVAEPPHVVRAAIGSSRRIPDHRSDRPERRRVISTSSARALRRMLVSVTTDGTGRAAAVPGYSVGGKTGTAQKIDDQGRYSGSKHVAWFAGFVPAERPELVMVVMLDEPQGPRFHGGDVAAPVFAKVARPVLQYLGIAPDRDGTLVFDRAARTSLAPGDAGDGNEARAGFRAPVRRGSAGRARGRLPEGIAVASLVGFARGKAAPDGPAPETEIAINENELLTTMPDVGDMGLRAASETLAAAGLSCRARGEGRRVTRQKPSPGARVARGGSCTVVY